MSQTLRKLQARKAALVTSARAMTDQAAAESRDLTIDEITAFDGLRAQIDAASASIDRETALIADEAQMGIQSALGVTVTDNIEKDTKRGFRSFGDFAKAVAGVTTTGARDQRLGYQAAAPATYSNESAGADGGFAIPPEFSKEIWRLSLAEDNLLPLTQNTEVTGNSMIFPKDETVPWGTNGVQVYWQGEAAAGTPTKPVLGVETLMLHKMMALVPVTNELINDGMAIGSYLEQVVPERVAWKVNEAILYGDGIAKPLGCLNAAATVVQAKDTNQATLTVSTTNLSKMVSRLLAGQMRNAFWLATPDILPALEGLTVGQIPVFLPSQNVADGSYGTLKGRPLILSEHAAAFTSQGDLNLLNLKGYRTITKAGGLETATSMHLYFDADATAFRFIFRINGKPILSGPVTPPKSSNTRSHFVTLAAR